MLASLFGCLAVLIPICRSQTVDTAKGFREFEFGSSEKSLAGNLLGLTQKDLSFEHEVIVPGSALKEPQLFDNKIEKIELYYWKDLLVRIKVEFAPVPGANTLDFQSTCWVVYLITKSRFERLWDKPQKLDESTIEDADYTSKWTGDKISATLYVALRRDYSYGLMTPKTFRTGYLEIESLPLRAAEESAKEQEGRDYVSKRKDGI
ncbi:MAG TPA: hypothetical protein VHC86_01365 [Opitutaceae bacterium]|nr:hypothetical protein [Opitutaceae bacterium]